ncbi:MAG TPA: hypothetical protein VF395_13300, partial [Polyangiaceae bacterium]
MCVGRTQDPSPSPATPLAPQIIAPIYVTGTRPRTWWHASHPALMMSVVKDIQEEGGTRVDWPETARGDEVLRFTGGNDPRLRFMEPVLAYAEMLEMVESAVPHFPPNRLIAMVRTCGWEETFLSLARMASLLANAPGGAHDKEVRARTTGLLGSTLRSDNAEERVVAFYVLVKSPRIVAHEEVIYFLQSLAVLYGLEAGPAPSEGQLAFWMLAGNDHCFGWREEKDGLSVGENLVASSARSLLFNHQHDALPEFVRSVAMLERCPPRTGGWETPEKWQ